ncbi:rhodanese-like domain-containing protein [Candidatus Leptofilum sp.]|uniref:rhodanese-like domain-containing protein n=1 Tax=Candidatus Leptofilum sp. TaxID=3241576 RepID=UPI003B59C619
MKTYKYFVFLLIFGLMMVACGGDTATEEPVIEPDTPAVEVVEEEAEVAEDPVEEVVEETVEEVVEAAIEPITAEELDAAYGTFVASLQGYNALKDYSLLNEQLISDSPPFILDVRNPAELEELGHIEGAVNIPLKELVQNLDLLPSFDTHIVTYCKAGWRAAIAMTTLGALGWENVQALHSPSYTGWVEEGYPTVEGLAPEAEVLNAANPNPAMVLALDEVLNSYADNWNGIDSDGLATEIVENPDLILIDVRTPGEVEAGTIDAPNVVTVALDDFIGLQENWPADKDAPIVTYCKAGHRSTVAMNILKSYGYTNVRSLKGGYTAYSAAGYALAGVPEPTYDMDAAFTTFLDDMEAYNTIGLDALNVALVEDPPPFLLDVREVAELEEKGHIEGAVNIPLRELADNIQYLPSFDTPIVSYCGSGWRCTIALTVLEAMGWEDVRCLKGGSFGGWVEAGYPIIDGVAEEPLLLDVAKVEPAALDAMKTVLHNVPDGFGGISVDDFNLALLENPDLFVIDVRSTEELEEKGVIEAENWVHIPLETFVAMQDQWPADPDTPIVVYCGSGHRSTIAMSILWAYGYSDVHSLKGGFGGWVEAGYPSAEFVAP